MQSNTEWVTIGKVVAPIGVRGETKVFLLTDIPNRFAELELVYLGPDHIPQRIESLRPYKGTMVVLKFEGFNDMSAADTLRNRDVCIPLAEMAKLPPDSYYQHDILGLRVFLMSGAELGEIVEILPTGGNDVYTVKTSAGRQVLIPAIKQVIKQVDLIRRAMYIDPLPGLLDDEDTTPTDAGEE
ncbi:MAG: ribosome maturation factor RimM [Chloroflexota bacterium]|nr:ribosome maturation factor RimM [Chloroflexota bacterium]